MTVAVVYPRWTERKPARNEPHFFGAVRDYCLYLVQFFPPLRLSQSLSLFCSHGAQDIAGQFRYFEVEVTRFSEYHVHVGIADRGQPSWKGAPLCAFDICSMYLPAKI